MLFYTVKVEGADKCAEIVGDMLTTISDFPAPMAEEFVTWQRDDMRRSYPKVDVVDPMTVATSVYPRSRASARYYKQRERQAPRKRRMVIKSAGRQRAGSNRPILRPSLFEKLCTRMDELMQRLIRWG